MEIRYRVDSCADQTLQGEAVIDGVRVPVAMPGLLVELVSLDGTMSKTLRFRPKDVEAAKALYGVGAIVVSTDKKEGEE